MGSSQSSTSSSSDGSAPKKSLYQRAQEKKRGPGTSGLSDEDLKKYTGKTRAEFDAWKETTPGAATAGGLGGWGPGAEPNDPNRGMKFPPQPLPRKESFGDESEEEEVKKKEVKVTKLTDGLAMS